MKLAVEMKGITMRFAKVIANDNVDFSVREGEIHALVGENGAGKSTLMNILYGLYKPSQGEIKINGEKVCFNSAIDAIHTGIGMVHQHFMLIPRLTVADNIVLGEETRKWILYDRQQALQKIDSLSQEYEINLDSKAKIADISLGMQQRVEIMKALYRQAKIIILDEPTAVLTPQEINELGTMLKKLKRAGKTVIIITHKLQEVIDFSDRVTVLRRGKIVGTVGTSETTPEEITQMMVGRSVKLGGEKVPVHYSGNVLTVDSINYNDGKKYKLKNISLTIRKGEILGIAGIDNSGQKELTEIIAGVLKPASGTIQLEEQDITGRHVKEIKKLGVGFIPQDRQKDGIAINLSIRENMVLGYHWKKAFIKGGMFTNSLGLSKEAKEKIEKFDIRPANDEAIVKNLSGGNQQKVIVAREVSNASKLIIADQPTRGVDIGAIELIHKTLVEARNDGQAVLLVSLELDEVMMLSDRIAVLHDGELMGIIDGRTATREEIGLMMVGQRRSEGYEK